MKPLFTLRRTGRPEFPKLEPVGALAPEELPAGVVGTVAPGAVLLTVTPKLDEEPPLLRRNSVGTLKKID